MCGKRKRGRRWSGKCKGKCNDKDKRDRHGKCNDKCDGNGKCDCHGKGDENDNNDKCDCYDKSRPAEQPSSLR